MNAPSNFQEAYGTLQRHAETLRNQREPDLDNLLKVVTESVSAYQVCKARIDAVEKALEEALSGAGVAPAPVDTGDTHFEGGGAQGARQAKAHTAPMRTSVPVVNTPVSSDDLDDDIPFYSL